MDVVGNHRGMVRGSQFCKPFSLLIQYLFLRWQCLWFRLGCSDPRCFVRGVILICVASKVLMYCSQGLLCLVSDPCCKIQWLVSAGQRISQIKVPPCFYKELWNESPAKFNKFRVVWFSFKASRQGRSISMNLYVAIMLTFKRGITCPASLLRLVLAICPACAKAEVNLFAGLEN